MPMNLTRNESMDRGLRLKPFHVGNHQDHRYMVNIEEMEACPIDEETADLLKQVNDNGDSFWRSQNKEELQALGLISQKRKEAARKAPKDPVPIVNAALFLIQSCNLRCVYCYGEGGEYGHKGNMEEKTAFQAVDWVNENGVKSAFDSCWNNQVSKADLAPLGTPQSE